MLDAAEGIVVPNSRFVDTFGHQTAWLPSAAFDIRTQPSSISSFIKIARGYGQNGLSGVFFRGLKNKTIQLEEHDADREACPLLRTRPAVYKAANSIVHELGRFAILLWR